MVFKDTRFEDTGTQVTGGDIDLDFMEEIKFLKENILRLQAELNAMSSKMKANEKAMKTASREKQDAVLTSKAYEQALKDNRQESLRGSNMVSQYKLMHSRAQIENDQLAIQIGKLTSSNDHLKRNDKLAEKVITKLHDMAGRKDVLIKDMDGLLEMLECYSSAD